MSKDNTNTAAETVAALQRQKITHAEITVQAETVARWTNYINGRDVETVHTFKPGDVVQLGSWRPEGMHATTADGFEMFVFWRFLEEMTTAPQAERADVRGDVEELDEDASEYETAARAFLVSTGATFSARFLGFFDSVEEWGRENGANVRGVIPVWRVTISTACGRLSVRFRGSINDGREGREAVGVYDVLAALTKYEPGTFDEFAHEFGYFPINAAEDYRHARKVWRACWREWRGVCRVWPKESDRAALAEIN